MRRQTEREISEIPHPQRDRKKCLDLLCEMFGPGARVAHVAERMNWDSSQSKWLRNRSRANESTERGRAEGAA